MYSTYHHQGQQSQQPQQYQQQQQCSNYPAPFGNPGSITGNSSQHHQQQRTYSSNSGDNNSNLVVNQPQHNFDHAALQSKPLYDGSSSGSGPPHLNHQQQPRQQDYSHYQQQPYGPGLNAPDQSFPVFGGQPQVRPYQQHHNSNYNILEAPLVSLENHYHHQNHQQQQLQQQQLGGSGGEFNSSTSSHSPALSVSTTSSRPPLVPSSVGQGGFQHQPYGALDLQQQLQPLQQFPSPSSSTPSLVPTHPESTDDTTSHHSGRSNNTAGGGRRESGSVSLLTSGEIVASTWVDPRAPQPNVIAKSRRAPPTVNQPAAIQPREIPPSTTILSPLSTTQEQNYQYTAPHQQPINVASKFSAPLTAVVRAPPPRYQQPSNLTANYPQQQLPHGVPKAQQQKQQQQASSGLPPRHAMVYLRSDRSDINRRSGSSSIISALPILGQLLEIRDESQLRDRLFVPQTKTPNLLVASDDFVSILHLLASHPSDLDIPNPSAHPDVSATVDVLLDLIMFRWGKIGIHALEWAESQLNHLSSSTTSSTCDLQMMLAQRLVDRCISLVPSSAAELFEDSGSKGLTAMCGVSPRLFASVRSFLAESIPQQQLLRYTLCKTSTEILLKCINHEGGRTMTDTPLPSMMMINSATSAGDDQKGNTTTPPCTVISALERLLCAPDLHAVERVALDHCGSFIFQAWVSKCSMESLCSLFEATISQGMRNSLPSSLRGSTPQQGSNFSLPSSSLLLFKLADGVGNYPLQTMIQRLKEEEEKDKSSLELVASTCVSEKAALVLSQLKLNLHTWIAGAKHAAHVAKKLQA